MNSTQIKKQRKYAALNKAQYKDRNALLDAKADHLKLHQSLETAIDTFSKKENEMGEKEQKLRQYHKVDAIDYVPESVWEEFNEQKTLYMKSINEMIARLTRDINRVDVTILRIDTQVDERQELIDKLSTEIEHSSQESSSE